MAKAKMSSSPALCITVLAVVFLSFASNSMPQSINSHHTNERPLSPYPKPEAAASQAVMVGRNNGQLPTTPVLSAPLAESQQLYSVSIDDVHDDDNDNDNDDKGTEHDDEEEGNDKEKEKEETKDGGGEVEVTTAPSPSPMPVDLLADKGSVLYFNTGSVLLCMFSFTLFFFF